METNLSGRLVSVQAAKPWLPWHQAGMWVILSHLTDPAWGVLWVVAEAEWPCLHGLQSSLSIPEFLLSLTIAASVFLGTWKTTRSASSREVPSRIWSSWSGCKYSTTSFFEKHFFFFFVNLASSRPCLKKSLQCLIKCLLLYLKHIRFMFQRHINAFSLKDARLGIWGWHFFFPALSSLVGEGGPQLVPCHGNQHERTPPSSGPLLLPVPPRPHSHGRWRVASRCSFQNACISSEPASACGRKPTRFHERIHCQWFKNRPLFWL